jgi:hypothetical protein
LYQKYVTRKEAFMTQEAEYDPLDAVFETQEEIEGRSREKLARMLIPYAVIDPETGTFYQKHPWYDLNSKLKVLVYLLARLALSLRRAEFSNSVSAKQVEMDTEMPGGTVRPKLSELMKDRIAYRDSQGIYYVKPTASVINRAWMLMEDEVQRYEAAQQNRNENNYQGDNNG